MSVVTGKNLTYGDPEEIIKCPFDPVHLLRRKRMPYHIIKCGKNFNKKDFSVCPFNSRHILPKNDFEAHLMVCQDRGIVEREMIHNKQFSEGILPIQKGYTDVPISSFVPPEPEECWDDSNVVVDIPQRDGLFSSVKKSNGHSPRGHSPRVQEEPVQSHVKPPPQLRLPVMTGERGSEMFKLVTSSKPRGRGCGGKPDEMPLLTSVQRITSNGGNGYHYGVRGAGSAGPVNVSLHVGGVTQHPGSHVGGVTQHPGGRGGGVAQPPGSHVGGVAQPPGGRGGGVTQHPGSHGGGVTQHPGSHDGGVVQPPEGVTQHPGGRGGGVTQPSGGRGGGVAQHPGGGVAQPPGGRGGGVTQHPGSRGGVTQHPGGRGGGVAQHPGGGVAQPPGGRGGGVTQHPGSHVGGVAQHNESEEKKKERKLKKMLRQILELEEKKAKGHPLDPEAIAKISRKDDVISMLQLIN